MLRARQFQSECDRCTRKCWRNPLEILLGAVCRKACGIASLRDAARTLRAQPLVEKTSDRSKKLSTNA
ncbi:MAG: hypothetical protein V7K40_24065 [Nostoc sp.]|uniref:hypothetical protein n=1 Tax=Nostoc sp. TaxID=1180 RepID=UPI002FFA466B